MKVTPKLKRKSIVLSYKLYNVLYEVYTGISVEPERWSTSKKLIKGEGEVIAEKNAKIKRYQKEIEHDGYSKAELNGTKHMLLKVKKGASKELKANIMKEWYRKELKNIIPDLITKWEDIIGVKSSDWGVKQMRTKWGACNIEDKRIWLNLELAKKPIICLEYIIVHELVHLLERNHNDRFVGYMDEFMPKWRLHRDELNNLPVAHNDWGY